MPRKYPASPLRGQAPARRFNEAGADAPEIPWMGNELHFSEA